MTRFILFLRQISWPSTLSVLAAFSAFAVLIGLVASTTTNPAPSAASILAGTAVAITLALTSIALAILSGRD